jgi:hypothetical protein
MSWTSVAHERRLDAVEVQLVVAAGRPVHDGVQRRVHDVVGAELRGSRARLLAILSPCLAAMRRRRFSWAFSSVVILEAMP